MASVLVAYLVRGEKTTQSQFLSAIAITVGALITSIATFDLESTGILLTLATNLLHSIQNLHTAKANENKFLSPFGK